MMYSQNRAATTKTQKVTLKPMRIIDLGNQRVAEKRLNESNFTKRSENTNNLMETFKMSRQTPNHKTKVLTMCHSFELSIAKQSPLLQSQTEYIAALEHTQGELKTKLKDLQKKLKDKDNERSTISLMESRQSIRNHMYLLELEKYYTESRKLLLTCSMELIDCKSMICQANLDVQSERIYSINSLLHKNQTLLKTFNHHERPCLPIKEEGQLAELMVEVESLRQINAFQEKTIQQLKSVKQNDQKDLFETEQRLLRHQINRIFLENQQLKKDLGEKYSEFFDKMRMLKDITPQTSKYLREYLEIDNHNNRLRQDLHKITIEKNFFQGRLNQQKEHSTKLQDEIKKIKGGQSTPVFREEYNPQNQLLMQTISELRQKLLVTETLLDEANTRLNDFDERTTNSQLLTPHRAASEEMSFTSLNNKSQISPIALKIVPSGSKYTAYEALQQQLVNCPDLILLLQKYNSQNQQQIQSLKQLLQTQRNDKQRTLLWCKKTYELLRDSKLPSQLIEQHLRELYELDSKEKQTRISRFLRQIQSVTNSFDRLEKKEVEQELNEYVLALKKRGSTIKEVSNEDGSSVMINDCQSEAFTEMDRLSDSEI